MVLISPGVEVNLQDYSDYTTSASSCIAGIIGTSTKGPSVALVTSVEQFENVFGKPDTKSYGSYAAIEFLKQGNQLYYQRVLKRGEKATSGVEGVDKLLFTAVEEGTASNALTIDVTKNEDDETVNISIKRDLLELEDYRFLSMDPDSTEYVPKKINGVSNLITVQVSATGAAATKVFTLSGGTEGATKATSTPDTEKTKPAVFSTKTVDMTVNGGKVTITTPDTLGYADYTLTDSKGEVLERFAGVNIKDATDPRYIADVLTAYSSYLEVTIPTDADPLNGSYSLAGAKDGASELTTSDYLHRKGPIATFSDANVYPITVLAIPGITDVQVLKAAIDMCEVRQDVMLLCDIPYGMSNSQAIDWTNASGAWSGKHTAFDSYLAAFYGPWANLTDVYNGGRLIPVPATLAVLPRYAYAEKVNGLGSSPAGVNRGRLQNIVSLERQLTPGEADAWYGGRNIINPIMNFGVDGICINGQKTAQRRASALDRVNVVRVVTHVRRQVLQISRQFLFESNHTATYQRWLSVVDPMLEALKNARVITDYVISMDEEFVTDYDRDNSRLPGKISIKPTKLVEFIDISLRLDSQTTSYLEN